MNPNRWKGPVLCAAMLSPLLLLAAGEAPAAEAMVTPVGDALEIPGIDDSAAEADIFQVLYGKTRTAFVRLSKLFDVSTLDAMDARNLMRDNGADKIVVSAGVDQQQRISRQNTARNELRHPYSATLNSRGGLNYRLTEQAFFYTRPMRGFQPDYHPDIDIMSTLSVEPLQREVGLGYEAGINLAAFDERFAMSATVFNFAKKNILTAPVDGQSRIFSGVVESRGLNINLFGRISPDWKIGGGYRRAQAEVVGDAFHTVSHATLNVPEDSFSVFSVYRVFSGHGQDFAIGGGLTYVADRAMNGPAAGPTLSGYRQADFAAFYQPNARLTFAVNVSHAFEETYYEAALDNIRVAPGPLTVLVGTAAMNF